MCNLIDTSTISMPTISSGAGSGNGSFLGINTNEVDMNSKELNETVTNIFLDLSYELC